VKTKVENKRLSFKEAQSIARDFAVEKLQEMNFPRESLSGLMINYLQSNDETTLELYRPGLRPIDAEVILTVTVSMSDGTVTYK
jgi:hypothetical protein